MQEVCDHYIKAEILLPSGDEMVMCNTSRNIVESAHMSPSFDTRMYQMEFAEFTLTELTSNVILEKCIPSVQTGMNIYS